jgi:hypothetical protein
LEVVKGGVAGGFLPLREVGSVAEAHNLLMQKSGASIGRALLLAICALLAEWWAGALQLSESGIILGR